MVIGKGNPSLKGNDDDNNKDANDSKSGRNTQSNKNCENSLKHDKDMSITEKGAKIDMNADADDDVEMDIESRDTQKRTGNNSESLGKPSRNKNGENPVKNDKVMILSKSDDNSTTSRSSSSSNDDDNDDMFCEQK